MYGVALHNTVHSQPCDQFFLLYSLMSGVVTSDSVLSVQILSEGDGILEVYTQIADGLIGSSPA